MRYRLEQLGYGLYGEQMIASAWMIVFNHFLSQSECLYEEIGFSQCHFQSAMSYSGAWGDSFSLYGSEGFGSLEA